MDSIRRTVILVIACILISLMLSACAPGVASISLSPEVTGAAGSSVSGERDLKVALVYVPGSPSEHPTLDVYCQLLDEEGFPYETVDARSLEGLSPFALRRSFSAIILPEGVNSGVSKAFAKLVEQYVASAGGKALIAFDAGTADEQGRLRTEYLFSGCTGVSLARPETGGASNTGSQSIPGYFGPWVLPKSSPLRRYYEEGVLAGDTAKLNGFPAAQDYHFLLDAVDAVPLAYGKEGPQRPEDAAMTAKYYPSGGVAVYVNGKLGSLKVNGNNDFMMRDPLKYFLIEIARVPRLVSSPDGIGGLVLNIHICSGVYFKDLDRILKQDLLSKEIPFFFAVTAGPDCDAPGDQKGFDAENPEKGLPYLQQLKDYGSIGAHGGWIHNYWAYHFAELSSQEKKEYIDKNFDALEKATGRAVREYAAPGGMHSLEVSDFIADRGVVAASIPTSFCSPPTHGWFDGKREDRFWLFGYTGTQYGMAFENMLAARRSPKNIEQDLFKIVDTVVEKREIRLFYSHPLSIASHPDMWRKIQGYVLAKVHAGELSVRTAEQFADFLDRHSKAKPSVERTSDGFLLRARSSASLREMAFAVPLDPGSHVVSASGFPVRVKDGWAYVAIDKDVTNAEIRVVVAREGGTN